MQMVIISQRDFLTMGWFVVSTRQVPNSALGTGYVGASIKYGNPISTHADHNPIADLTACTVNQYYELVNAAHARDGVNGEINTSSIYYVMGNREMQILAILSLAIPEDAYYCA